MSTSTTRSVAGFRRIPAAALAAALATLPVLAAPGGTTIPLGANGSGYNNSRGQPVALTATSFLESATGPDDTEGTADDVTLLITGAGSTNTVTALATPFTGSAGTRIVRVSSTRALVVGSGADGWNSGDEVLFLLDDLGSDNTVTSFEVGRLDDLNGHMPVVLSATSVAITSWGADGNYPTADDVVILVTDLGGTNTVTTLPAPYIEWSGRARPTVLSPTSMLLVSAGPDGSDTSADDLTYLWTDLGGANTRTDLETPNPGYGLPGMPVRLSATRAALCGEGDDSGLETADDVVLLLDGLGSTNTVTAIPAPYLYNYGAAYIVPIDGSTAMTTHHGADGSDGTADDAILLLSDLGGANTTTSIPVGAIDEDRQCRPVFLPPSGAAVVTYGPDTSSNNADDTVSLVADLGGANTVTTVTVPGLSDGTASAPVLLSPTAIALCSGGPDGTTDAGSDDVISVVSGIGSTPMVETVALGGDINHAYSIAFAPVVLGGGRAVCFTAGPDGDIGGADDGVLLLEGLPEGASLFVRKASLKFKEAKPEKGEKATVSGTLLFNGAPVFGAKDVTVSVGNAMQTLPAASWTEKKGNWTYSDPKGLAGMVRKVVWKAKKGKLLIKTKGVATGVETTDPASVILGLTTEDDTLAVSLTGTAKKSGILYKAPK